jgi:hypothetical protein
MGVDIHAFIEVGQSNFISCYAEVNILRSHDLFNTLGEFPLKGLPEKISGVVHNRFFLMVAFPEQEKLFKEDAHGYTYTSWVPKNKADKWVASGRSFYEISQVTGEIAWVSNPDWYTPNWLTLEECETALKRYRETSEHLNWDFAVVVETMRSIESYTSKGFTRLLFWFDV